MKGFGRTCALALSLALAACGGGPRGDGGVRVDSVTVNEMRSPAGPGSVGPAVVAGPDGRVYLSWTEPGPDSTYALRFSILGKYGWSPPRTIAQGKDWFVNWADVPTLAVLPNGTMAAQWLQKSGAGAYAYDVRVAVSRDGGATWTAGAVPHRDGVAAEHGFVSMWPAGDSVALVWLDGRGTAGEGHGGATAVYYATVGMDGGIGAETAVDSRVCDCCQTGAAMTSRGPVVVYRDRSPEEIRDIYLTRYENGAWTEARPVHADGWHMEACPVNGPQAAADGERLAVAWFTGAGDSRQVKVSFSSDAGTTFGEPVRVDEGDPEGRVDVVLEKDGAALVTWMERVAGGGAEVRMRRVTPRGQASLSIVVAKASAARASGFPRMALLGGEVVVAWTAPGDSGQVKVARMDAPAR